MRLLPANHPVYMAWASMKRRCNNPNTKDFKYYGGRGISYCAEWETFAGFYADVFPTWEAGLTFDRADSDLDYGPNNCRWVTVLEQRRNRRNCLDVGLVYATKKLIESKVPLTEIAVRLNIPLCRVNDISSGRSWEGV